MVVNKMTIVAPIESIPVMNEINIAANRVAEALYNARPPERNVPWNDLDIIHQTVWINMAKDAIHAGRQITPTDQTVWAALETALDAADRGFDAGHIAGLLRTALYRKTILIDMIKNGGRISQEAIDKGNAILGRQ